MAESAPSTSKSGNTTSEKNHTQQPGDAYCVLTRISDNTYIEHAKRSYPLTQQHLFGDYYRNDDGLNFAQYYAGMRCLFGKPGNLYDDWKGSFSFSFQVDVFRDEHVYSYLLHIMHMRSSVEFQFSKTVADPENHDPLTLMTYHAPLEDELSAKEMLRVKSYMTGFLEGYLKAIQRSGSLDVPDFVLLTESNHIISGYSDGKFFERYPEESDDFEVEKDSFQDLIDNPVAEWPNDVHLPTTLTIKLGNLK